MSIKNIILGLSRSLDIYNFIFLSINFSFFWFITLLQEFALVHIFNQLNTLCILSL